MTIRIIVANAIAAFAHTAGFVRQATDGDGRVWRISSKRSQGLQHFPVCTRVVQKAVYVQYRLDLCVHAYPPIEAGRLGLC